MSMELLLASGLGIVTATGVFLMLRGRTWPVVLGLSLLGYAVNVFLFAMGKLWLNAAPMVHTGAHAPPMADPLPPALVLTAIVIGFATSGLLIALAVRSAHDSHTDHVGGKPPQEPPHV